MQKITTTIKRQFLREIAAKRKRVEYRDIKDYWEKRFAGVKTPFQLRLINGMSKAAPELTVQVTRLKRDSRNGQFELHLGRIVEIQNWDRKTEQPTGGRKHR